MNQKAVNYWKHTVQNCEQSVNARKAKDLTTYKQFPAAFSIRNAVIEKKEEQDCVWKQQFPAQDCVLWVAESISVMSTKFSTSGAISPHSQVEKNCSSSINNIYNIHIQLCKTYFKLNVIEIKCSKPYVWTPSSISKSTNKQLYHQSPHPPTN